MLTIIVNREEYEYDCYAMVTSFFPGIETRQVVDGGASTLAEGEVRDAKDAERASDAPDSIRVLMDREKRCASVSFTAGDVLPRTQHYRVDSDDIVNLYPTEYDQGRMAEERAYKRACKLFFYDVLLAYTGRQLPWGALSGVRPTKLIRSIIAQERGNAGGVRATEAADAEAAGAETGDAIRDLDAACVKGAGSEGDDALRGLEAAGAEAAGAEGYDALRERVTLRMYEDYRVSEEKAALGYEIATLEERLIAPYREGGWSLYVGIPFCPSRCLYCSFASYEVAAWQGRVHEYLGCLRREMEEAARLMAGQRLDTVYIGGGTPTALSAEELKRLLSDLAEVFGMSAANRETTGAERGIGVRGSSTAELSAGRGQVLRTAWSGNENNGAIVEYTVEAGRPDSITPEKLRVLREYGVDRISVNPQSFHDETLRRIGRAHNVSDVRRAYAQAREAGFTNINMDLILGLPGESLSDIRETLAEAAALEPDSLTVHSLALKRASRMREEARARDLAQTAQAGAGDGSGRQAMAQEGLRKARPDAQGDGAGRTLRYDAAMAAAHETARALGLRPYYLYRQKNIAGALENTGFAREGAYGLYNILMMEEVQSIYAIGAGTVSKRVAPDGDITRCDTHKDLALYLSDIDAMLERKRRLFGS